MDKVGGMDSMAYCMDKVDEVVGMDKVDMNMILDIMNKVDSIDRVDSMDLVDCMD